MPGDKRWSIYWSLLLCERFQFKNKKMGIPSGMVRVRTVLSESGHVDRNSAGTSYAYFGDGKMIECGFYFNTNHVPKCKEDCYWYQEDIDMGARIPYCNPKNYKVLEPSDCNLCSHYHSKYVKTGGDMVRSMTDEELSEWFWKTLDYTKNYTDSRVALNDWLRKPIE